MKSLRQVVPINEGLLGRAGKAVWNSFFRGEQERSKEQPFADARPGKTYSMNKQKNLNRAKKRRGIWPRRQMEDE